MADMAASPGGNEVAHGGTLELCFFSPVVVYCFRLTDHDLYGNNIRGASLDSGVNPVGIGRAGQGVGSSF